MPNYVRSGKTPYSAVVYHRIRRHYASTWIQVTRHRRGSAQKLWVIGVKLGSGERTTLMHLAKISYELINTQSPEQARSLLEACPGTASRTKLVV